MSAAAAEPGLSTHTQIIIGIIIPVAALVGGISFFIWYTERQRRRRMADSSLPPARFARISSFLHNDNDKATEVDRIDSVNDIVAHPARTTSLAPKAYVRKYELSDTGKCELQVFEKLGELKAENPPTEVPSTPVDGTPKTADRLDGMEAVSPMTVHQSHELDASNQINDPKVCEKRMSYQRQASVSLRSSLRSNIFAIRKSSTKYSKEASSSAGKDRSSVDSSAPRLSSNIEFLKDGTNLNKEVVITTTRREGSFEDAARGLYSPTVSAPPRLEDQNSVHWPMPGTSQDRNSCRFSHDSIGIAELSARNSRSESETTAVQSPISERFSESPPSWMKRLGNDKSQRSSMGADEKLNEAGAVGPFSKGRGDGGRHGEPVAPSSPLSNEKNTAILISAASSAQRQRSRSRPRRKPVEVEEMNHDFDDAENKQAEEDAMDIIQAVSPTLTQFRV